MVDYVKNGDTYLELSNESKLEIYALYKQAKHGNLKGNKPHVLDIVKRDKFLAWDRLRGMSREEAMKQYIKMVGLIRTSTVSGL